LKGYPGLWRLRIAGRYRVVFRLDERARMVRVQLVGHRRDVYRDLRPNL
jgi:mRNA-degrading endonuclease RelE of RelBE toxin-antitoxin system